MSAAAAAAAAAVTVNVCPMCCKKKPAADDEGHCSYACASGGGSVTHATRVTEAPAVAPVSAKARGALTVTTLADGRIQVSGATFRYRDQIKARGGRWDPAARVWTLPAGTDTVFEVPLPAAVPAPAPAPAPAHYVRRDRSGRCCAAATAAMDKADPYGPLWYHCKVHGSCRSSYSGD